MYRTIVLYLKQAKARCKDCCFVSSAVKIKANTHDNNNNEAKPKKRWKKTIEKHTIKAIHILGKEIIESKYPE